MSRIEYCVISYCLMQLPEHFTAIKAGRYDIFYFQLRNAKFGKT